MSQLKKCGEVPVESVGAVVGWGVGSSAGCVKPDTPGRVEEEAVSRPGDEPRSLLLMVVSDSRIAEP